MYNQLRQNRPNLASLRNNVTSSSDTRVAVRPKQSVVLWTAADTPGSKNLVALPTSSNTHNQSGASGRNSVSSTGAPSAASAAVTERQCSSSSTIQCEDMEIDSAPVPPPQEYSDCPSAHQSESSMNFDYLHGLREGISADSAMEATSSSSTPLNAIVDDSKVVDRPFDLNERFVTVLDQLDARVERFRKDALGLQEKRDFLLMSIDLIKSNDLLTNMNESEREEISCYIQRVNSRLSTVELNVRTVRDSSQEDSLSQINALIDMMITMGDPVLSRQRCQQYLNSCSSSTEFETSADGSGSHMQAFSENSRDGAADAFDMEDGGPVDKVFESVLLGCTLDDQKNVKKRLQALMGYLNKQTIRN